MAWRTQATSNEKLIDGLLSNDVLSSKEVEQAMRKVDRGDYTDSLTSAYVDSPQSIGYGVTISAPHMHAACLEILEERVRKQNARVLDVGSGSGYLSACFGRMAGSGAKVIGIDVVQPLVEWSIRNMKKHDGDLLESGIVTLKVGDGWKGDPNEGPFDAIHVGAAAETLPQALVEQLAPNGRMVIPVGPQGGNQYLLQVDKSATGAVTTKNIMAVQYVPLVKK